MLMKYAVQIVDDAESNIFEGLQSLIDGPDLPAEWSKSTEDEGLEESGVFSRDALNARFDLIVECWECRLA